MERKKKEHKISNYRIHLLEDQTHRTLLTIKFTRRGFIISAISAVIFTVVAIYCLIAFTPIRTTIPGYPDDRSKMIAIQNAIKVDSLERVFMRWELYSENIRRVMEGENPVKIDSVMRLVSSSSQKTKEELARRDSALRAQVVAAEQFELSNGGTGKLPIEGIHFFTPVKGVITQEYDRASHPYVDIAAPKNSPVMAILEGTVIFSGWDEDTGYTIQIQHDNDLVSIYRHNERLLKKVGDKVQPGTPVAFLGGTGMLSTGDHLHLELWYKGEAVNPAKYISF